LAEGLEKCLKSITHTKFSSASVFFTYSQSLKLADPVFFVTDVFKQFAQLNEKWIKYKYFKIGNRFIDE
jgi:hypothetical protein